MSSPSCYVFFRTQISLRQKFCFLNLITRHQGNIQQQHNRQTTQTNLRFLNGGRNPIAKNLQLLQISAFCLGEKHRGQNVSRLRKTIRHISVFVGHCPMSDRYIEPCGHLQNNALPYTAGKPSKYGLIQARIFPYMYSVWPFCLLHRMKKRDECLFSLYGTRDKIAIHNPYTGIYGPVLVRIWTAFRP